MDPFARKMWLFGFIFASGMLVAFIAMSVVYFHARPRCSDTVVSSSTDLSNKWTATLMERRCGEESAFFAHVNLRPAGQPEHRGYFSGTVTDGEVFRVEDDAQSAGVSLEWTAPDRLTIRCPRCKPATVRQQDERWGAVTVTYEMRQR
jgi:hypothetical protein